MRFSSSTFLYGAGPLAALTLFAVLSVPASTKPAAPAKLRRLNSIHFDIKPGACPNTLNVGRADDDEMMCVDGAMLSVIPMSILGNKFDVDQVDLGSVGLSRAGLAENIFVRPLEFVYHDTGTPFVSEGCNCHALGGDGVIDLDMKFNKQEVIEAFGLDDEPNGTSVQLQISGIEVSDDSEFVGHDCVRIVHH